MYIVYREGVYMQGIIGAFEDKKNAKDAAVEAMKAEKDDYHTMVVIEMPLNKQHVPISWHEQRIDEKEIYRISRVGKTIHIKIED